jgi:uncharacterized membrane protein
LTHPDSASQPRPPGTPPAVGPGASTRRHVLLQTVEGRILLVGLFLALLALAAFAAGWVWYPDRTLIYGAMAGLNLTVGRAAGMSFGYASGLGHAQVVPLNMVIETIQVLVVYPLFALTWTHLIDTPRWTAAIERMHQSAEVHRGTIQRFGVLGLFVFVFTPFWMTGPVVGAIVGFLIGLRARTILTVVLTATYVAIGSWALLLNELSRWAAAYNHYAPYALVLALVLLALAGGLMKRLPGRRATVPRK